MKGAFIVFEGGEGSGKSTVAKFVAEELKKERGDVVLTREPGGSPYAEGIRQVILHENARFADAETMFALFWAARRDHLNRTVIPSLLRGGIVLCDRFDASSFAYQIHGQQQPQLETLFWHIRDHYLGPYRPDHYLLFDLDPAVGLARVGARMGERNHFDEREMDFHHRLREGYRQFMNSTEKQIAHSVIDASLPLPFVEQSALQQTRLIVH